MSHVCLSQDPVVGLDGSGLWGPETSTVQEWKETKRGCYPNAWKAHLQAGQAAGGTSKVAGLGACPECMSLDCKCWDHGHSRNK